MPQASYVIDSRMNDGDMYMYKVCRLAPHLICLDMILTACITQVTHSHTVICACVHLMFLCHMGGGGGGGEGDDVTTHVRESIIRMVKASKV